MTPEEQKAAQEAEAAAQAAAAAEAAKQAEPPPIPEDPKALRAELERARKEAAKYRVQARDAAEAKRKADDAALAEKGQFRELAEARAKEIEALKSELEPLRSTAATYQQQEAEERQKREAQVAVDFAALPEDIRSEIPDDADLRTKEIAVKTYQKASGQKPRPPSTPVTAPRPAATVSGEPPITPEQERVYSQIVGNAMLPREKREKAQAALNDLNAWRKQHPGR